MYYLIIKWKDGHTSTMRFGVQCVMDELASRYAKNHKDDIISITTKEVKR